MDGFPDFSTPDTAWPAYQQAEEEKLLSVYLSDIYLKVEAQNFSHCLQAASSRQQQTYMLLCLAFPYMTEKEIEQVSDLSVLRERAEEHCFGSSRECDCRQPRRFCGSHQFVPSLHLLYATEREVKLQADRPTCI